MNYNIIPTRPFAKAVKSLAKKYRSLKEDLNNLTKSLQKDPFQGTELTPGIRKVRMAISSKGRGKSGGARIITYTLLTKELNGEIYLLDIYDKADYSTIDIELLKQNLKNIIGEL